MRVYAITSLHDPSQPSIKAALQSKERWHETDLSLAMWFYDSCIPMNVVNSPPFQIAMSKVAGIGHGYTRPSYHAMRVTLKDVKQSVQLIVDSIDVIGQKMVVQLWEMGGVIQDNDPLSILWCIVQKGFPSSNQLMHWILRVMPKCYAAYLVRLLVVRM